MPLDNKFSLKAIACLTVVILSACLNTSPSSIAIEKDGLVDVAAITQNFDSSIGNSVLVRNDVIAKIGERGLILDKDRIFSGETILVISTSKIPSIFSSDQTPEVLVSGRVERFISRDLEPKYGLNLDSSLYNQYEGKPVIIATSLIFSPDPEDLTRNPEMYYGEQLAIKGEIEDIKSYGLFELDEEQVFGGEDLLVVQLNPRIELENEQTAIVYGVLRPFIFVELERDYDLGWDLSIQKQIEAEYSQKPVFVAEKIQILK
ncbi:conserved exported hypothetical protein [Hyella patelloides LEGE 07179]|uniref:Lipoprotein n=1 Tax=Hyella patelloides LEGE 07179 TaxID=945734 RepID=A0A563VZ06_9CYAN|nr:hypothetical protein [Hyella patelloides]VEP16656.1 conserved exported hypothetical protein [Hyella patelloides LEGE 07179]